MNDTPESCRKGGDASRLEVIKDRAQKALTDWRSDDYSGTRDALESAFALLTDLQTLERYFLSSESEKDVFKQWVEENVSRIVEKHGVELFDLALSYALKSQVTQHVLDWAAAMQSQQRHPGRKKAVHQERTLERVNDWICLADRLDLLCELGRTGVFRAAIAEDPELERRWNKLEKLLLELESLLKRHIHFLRPVEGAIRAYREDMRLSRLPKWWPSKLLGMRHPKLSQLIAGTSGKAVLHLRRCEYCAARMTVSEEVRSMFRPGVEPWRAELEVEGVQVDNPLEQLYQRVMATLGRVVEAALPTFTPTPASPVFGASLAGASNCSFSLEALMTFQKIFEARCFEVYLCSSQGSPCLSVIGLEKSFDPSKADFQVFEEGIRRDPDVTIRDRELMLGLADNSGFEEPTDQVPEEAVILSYLISVSYYEEVITVLVRRDDRPQRRPQSWLLRLESYLNESDFNRAVSLMVGRLHRSRSRFEKIQLVRLLQAVWHSGACDTLSVTRRDLLKAALEPVWDDDEG